ncbi:4-(cytidine 5'-diphospho)-2-C-methyl-D-erythritol kinase [Neiella marina]|uniref:4-diphosphocytidyl-2-C-methyl-D-erythritol kinase n=1 Tax=Neiella holothuriorum TaxID=2870530 RepID=A0ABS7EHL0_9GAMM|nr:4-(cytidine 5'-diphospho)-2-C-methyl-D-erythritol kinase [Neiella holothuriorum]MBW8191832.1 4-(cytidine 5'-diphospho)-2-C-methyl-D-erythritol kinase [Neiella holothuriorum]
MTNTITLPSPAKLNLFLHINGQLPNGYHELQTLFQFIDYGDSLTFSSRADGNIVLTTEMAGVAHDDNLIVRAARLLQQHTDCNQGVTISIDKVLPMGGGIGGGSSNAATVLLACNYIWNTKLPAATLAKLGLQLGADVPVFVHGKATLAEGVGEKFTDMNPPEPWYLVIFPNVHVNTATIFQHPDLPRSTPKLASANILASDLGNDCQKLVSKTYPQVEKALRWLLEYAPSKLTGTGSCVFASFETQQQAHQTLLDLPEPMTGFVAKGCNTSPLHNALQQYN